MDLLYSLTQDTVVNRHMQDGYLLWICFVEYLKTSFFLREEEMASVDWKYIINFGNNLRCMKSHTKNWL